MSYITQCYFWHFYCRCPRRAGHNKGIGKQALSLRGLLECLGVVIKLAEWHCERSVACLFLLCLNLSSRHIISQQSNRQRIAALGRNHRKLPRYDKLESRFLISRLRSLLRMRNCKCKLKPESESKSAASLPLILALTVRLAN